MPTTITCEDCGSPRSNVAYKNTRYCVSCRLLRDLLFVDDATRPCKHCRQNYAPISRRDGHCGECHFGTPHEGTCFFCKRRDAELHRPSIPVCVRCVRDPSLRRTIIAGLRKGQRERKESHAV